MPLKHFVKDTYKSIGEALLDIRKELQRLQPVDSGSISWEQTETGMSAHVGDGGMGGSMPAETPDEGTAGISDVSNVSAGYSGYFKVIWDNVVDEVGNVIQRRVKVIDGAKPESATAGATDLGTVSSSSVDIPSEAITLYLIATYAENKYKLYFSHEKPNGTYGYYILADISDDKISQVWTSGAIYFGERYYI